MQKIIRVDPHGRKNKRNHRGHENFIKIGMSKKKEAIESIQLG